MQPSSGTSSHSAHPGPVSAVRTECDPPVPKHKLSCLTSDPVPLAQPLDLCGHPKWYGVGPSSWVGLLGSLVVSSLEGRWSVRAQGERKGGGKGPWSAER